MKELVKIKNNGINARELYLFLEIKHQFRDWIKNSIRDYGFLEGKDFSYFYSESTGGRPAKEYVLSIGMSKELSMVSKTEKGKEARLYFIKCEELAREVYTKSKSIRLAGIEIRKSLTDTIKESGENERMHGHGYSNYTKRVYEICELKEAYKTYKKDYQGLVKFRDVLSPEQLKRVELAESLIKPLIELEKQYSEIKGTLNPLFEKKAIAWVRD